MRHSDKKSFSKEIELNGKFFDVDFTVHYTVTQDKGDYWTPPTHDIEIDELEFESIDAFNEDGDRIELADQDKDDLTDHIYEMDLDLD